MAGRTVARVAAGMAMVVLPLVTPAVAAAGEPGCVGQLLSTVAPSAPGAVPEQIRIEKAQYGTAWGHDAVAAYAHADRATCSG